MPDPLPWEIIETLPGANDELILEWNERLLSAEDQVERTRALVGRSLASYWAVAAGSSDATWSELASVRAGDAEVAIGLARQVGNTDLLAEALLGSLYACWGPDRTLEREPIVAELEEIRAEVEDLELQLRIREWAILGSLDRGELDHAEQQISAYEQESEAGAETAPRRVELWRANIALRTGAVDDATSVYADVADEIADAQDAGDLVSTLRFVTCLFRGDVAATESLRSARTAFPLSAQRWEASLILALSEARESEEARSRFDVLAEEDFDAVPRDLNWLMTMVLLGWAAANLGDAKRCEGPLAALRPYAALDATIGAGAASLGPVGRVVASLLACTGETEAAIAMFDAVVAAEPAGPWQSMTRLDRARAMVEIDTDLAGTEAGQAEAELSKFGATYWAAKASMLNAQVRLAEFGPPVAALLESEWSLRHPAGSANLPTGLGADALIELLTHPHDPIDVVQLDRRVDPPLVVGEPLEPEISDEARRDLTRQLRAIERRDDLTDSDEAEAEVLRRKLSATAYLASNSPEVERARFRMSNALSAALAAIESQDAGLAGMLDDAIDIGRRCVYAPADDAPWEIDRTA